MGQALNILICDDSILARKQLKDAILVANPNIQITESKDGAECVSAYKSRSFDLVFIDIVMPVLDGVSAVRGIMESDPNAVVIIVSSVGTQKELKAAIEAGASDFIQKPYSHDQIKEVIDFYSK